MDAVESSLNNLLRSLARDENQKVSALPQGILMVVLICCTVSLGIYEAVADENHRLVCITSLILLMLP